MHNLLNKRLDILAFSAARARGYLIGSGPAESAANHVVHQRMKRAGVRWQRDGARTMLALQSAWRSTKGFDGMLKTA